MSDKENIPYRVSSSPSVVIALSLGFLFLVARFRTAVADGANVTLAVEVTAAEPRGRFVAGFFTLLLLAPPRGWTLTETASERGSVSASIASSGSESSSRDDRDESDSAPSSAVTRFRLPFAAESAAPLTLLVLGRETRCEGDGGARGRASTSIARGDNGDVLKKGRLWDIINQCILARIAGEQSRES